MNTESLKEAIKRELPGWLRDDPDFRAYILDLTRREYAARAETQDRFYDLLAELRRDREDKPASGTSKTVSGKNKPPSGTSKTASGTSSKTASGKRTRRNSVKSSINSTNN